MQELFKQTRKVDLTGYRIFIFLFSISLFFSCNKKDRVEYREEQIVIPTYELASNEGGWWGIPGPQVLYCKALSLWELGLPIKADSAFKAMIIKGNADLTFKPHSAEDLKSVKKRYDLRKDRANASIIKEHSPIISLKGN